MAKTLSTISDASAKTSVNVKRPVGPLQIVDPKSSLASGSDIEGNSDCYWNDDGFDPVLRDIIREYLDLYWNVKRAPRVLHSEDYDGKTRIPINSYADFLRNDGWEKRALEMTSKWPKPVTFHREELMSKSWGGDVDSTRHIKRFRDMYERSISPHNLGKYLDVAHCLLLPSRLSSTWECFVKEDVRFLHYYAAHTRKGSMANFRRDWTKFLESMSHLVRRQILPPSVIMDPSIPVFPKNKMGWVAFGGDELFD